jgi:dimethylargininase
VDPAVFDVCAVVTIDPAEPWAANALRVGEHLLMPAGVPRTCERLTAAGLSVEEVAIDELQKAEAGLTCMSILVPMRSET